MNCECGNHMVKNGKYKGRQKWRCLVCKETFQEEKFHNKMSEKEKEMILKLAAKGTTVEAIAYAFEYSRQAIAGFLKKKDRPIKIEEKEYEIMIIDEIISYTEHKKIVNKKGGKIAKHAKGTTIWTIALYDKEGIRTVKAVVKKGEQTRKQFEENLEIMPKVKYVFSDSAISLRSSSKPKVSEAGLQPKKVSTCRRIFAREI